MHGFIRTRSLIKRNENYEIEKNRNWNGTSSTNHWYSVGCWLMTTTLMRCERLFNFINRRQLKRSDDVRCTLLWKQNQIKVFRSFSMDSERVQCDRRKRKLKWKIFFCASEAVDDFVLRFFSSYLNWIKLTYALRMILKWWTAAEEFFAEDSSINFLQLQLDAIDIYSMAGRLIRI